jgi:peptide/nickel transport system substrate-binding protein
MKHLTENLGGGRWLAAIECVSHRPSRREELLLGLQRLVHERVMFVPIYESGGLTSVGPRVAKPALGLISPYQWSGPYEEVRLKP